MIYSSFKPKLVPIVSIVKGMKFISAKPRFEDTIFRHVVVLSTFGYKFVKQCTNRKEKLVIDPNVKLLFSITKIIVV